MKRRKGLLIVGVILCLAMVPLFPSIAGAEGGVTVGIDAPAEVDEGTDFFARVTIIDVTNFDASNYDVTYDPTILEVTDVADGVIGGIVIPVEMWDFVPAQTQGTIRVIENVTGLPGVSGSGYLAEIHFHVVGEYCNASEITLSNGVLSDNTATEILATWVGDSAHVTAPQTPGGGSGGGGGGGGGRSAATPKLTVEMMGRVSSVPITKEGLLEEALEVAPPDGAVTLRLAEGTQVLDSEGNRLEKLTIDAVSEPLQAPERAHVIGVAYDFGPQGATFDPEIELIMQYDPEGLPDGVSEADLLIACYESQSGEFEFLPTVVDTEANTVSVWISHFTVFAIVGREEAAFHFANLSISPATVDRGESVSISAQVTNTGGMEGSCTVRLLIDGVEEATQELTLGPGAIDTITFTVTGDAEGSHSAEIAGLTGEFTVTAPSFPWALLGGVLAAVAAAVMAVCLVVSRRGRAAA